MNCALFNFGLVKYLIIQLTIIIIPIPTIDRIYYLSLHLTSNCLQNSKKVIINFHDFK